MHSIRLREPWNYGKNEHAIRRPQDWAALRVGRAVTIARHFNAPTGIDNGQEIRLVFEAVICPLHVAFNGSPIGDVTPEQFPQSFSVAALLQPHNQVAITLDLAAVREPLAGAPFELALQIH